MLYMLLSKESTISQGKCPAVSGLFLTTATTSFMQLTYDQYKQLLYKWEWSYYTMWFIYSGDFFGENISIFELVL